LEIAALRKLLEHFIPYGFSKEYEITTKSARYNLIRDFPLKYEQIKTLLAPINGSIPNVQNLDSPHPLTPSPKDGRRGTRIMSPLSHVWERGWG
jgi:hypothetical protein